MPKLWLYLVAGVVVGILLFSLRHPQLISPVTSPNYTASPSIVPSSSATPVSVVKTYTTSKPTDSPVLECSQFDPKQGLATVTITLKEKNGQKLSGTWTANINSSRDCPATFPGGITFWPNYIPDGQYTWTSVGFNPGRIRIDVNYRQTGQAFDIDATSGNHAVEAIVSN